MPTDISESLKRYLKSVIQDLEKVLTEDDAGEDDEDERPDRHYSELVTRASAAVDRLAPKRSAYLAERDRICKGDWGLSYKTELLLGVLRALERDLEHGYLETTTELLHAEVFTDFLEMAAHLLEAKYKDAAAVIAGSTLEGHLRALCAKQGIAVERPTKDGLKPKMSDTLNSELVAAGAYEKGDQKSVVAWLDIRNAAAHGHYEKYVAEQVGLMISGIRDFVGRVPG